MKEIPFFANLPDGTHCYQAALKMILTHLTEKEWSFENLDQISGKLLGKWTWPTLSLIWLIDNGFEVRLVEEFSYQAFAERGRDYLLEHYGKEVTLAQEKNSDIPREQKFAEQFISKANLDYRIPTWEDLTSLIKEGFLLICNVNANQLYEQPGYSGHFVVPVRITSDFIFLHDPGLPPKSSFKVSKKTFEKAWGFPTDHEKNILAIQLKK